MENLRKLQESLNYFFKDENLLKKALTHSSYANEQGIESNEKLEFLGDAVLELIISKYLFLNFKDLKEGEMTKVRATVVCEESLYKIAEKHNFSDFLFVGSNERNHEGNKNTNILADSVEAVIAAMYFDSDFEEVEKFIIDNLKEEIGVAVEHVGEKDHKTMLQEKLQENGNVDINYETIEETGPDHDKTFTVSLTVNGKLLANGMGKSKKAAEMEAARKALMTLE